jgi:hypothetical protein
LGRNAAEPRCVIAVILHFAYGSNMSRAVMRKRAPLAKAIGVATLANHSLWRLTPRDLVTLAAWENLAGGLYRAKTLAVRYAGRQSRALVYLARPCPTGRAKIGYMELVIAAALEWRLPQLYIDALRGFLPKQAGGAAPRYGKAFRWK